MSFKEFLENMKTKKADNCYLCDGSGIVFASERVKQGIRCPRCKGTGKIILYVKARSL